MAKKIAVGLDEQPLLGSWACVLESVISDPQRLPVGSARGNRWRGLYEHSYRPR
jgi:hypothetical protein